MVTKKKKGTKRAAPKKRSTQKKVARKKVRAASKHETQKSETAEISKPVERKIAPPPPPRAPRVPGTYFANSNEPRWRLVNAEGQRLGRLSSWIAQSLMGKDKPFYTRSSDTGDFIVVINAEKIILTGNKMTDKVYQHHTNYPGGLKTTTPQEILSRHPERLIKLAVYRMLPKGHMGLKWFKKLKVYPGSEHPHVAQKPQPVELPKLGY